MKRFWVIESEFGMTDGTRTAFGPFKSVAAAEKFIIEDSSALFDSDKEPKPLGADREWSLPVTIVEEKKSLQPVPVVTFEIKLEEAK